jgi:hypothetical protein
MTPSQQASTINKGATPQKLFFRLPPPNTETTTSYYNQWDNTQFDQVGLEIINEEDEISWDMPKPDPKGSIPKLLFDLDTELDKLFFEEMMPCVSGHALIIDKYFQDHRVDMQLIVKNDGIKFHYPEAEDPDWKVKHCYILLIASASEMEMDMEMKNGAENIWKSGKAIGRHCYANFGQCYMINMFKAVRAVAPFCWSGEEHWYTDKMGIPWEMFVPCIKAFNKQCNELLTTNLLVLDESMSGWRPNTSKYGGLPNYVLPHKGASRDTAISLWGQGGVMTMIIDGVKLVAIVHGASVVCLISCRHVEAPHPRPSYIKATLRMNLEMWISKCCLVLKSVTSYMSTSHSLMSTTNSASLCFEKKWPTKDCWFRLRVTLPGM